MANMDPDAQEPREAFISRRVRQVVVVVMVIAPFAAVACFGYAAWMSLEAEHNLHASRFAAKLVEHFVRTKARWPKSWEELEALAAQPGWPPPTPEFPGDMHQYQWPASWPGIAPVLRQRVTVDFAPEREVLRWSAGSLIKPNGPYYPYDDYGEFWRLVGTVRETIFNEKD